MRSSSCLAIVLLTIFTAYTQADLQDGATPYAEMMRHKKLVRSKRTAGLLGDFFGPSKYKLSQSNRGESFYSSNHWDFYSQHDPTHGTVNYTTQDDAQRLNLVGTTNDGQAFARASRADLNAGEYRKSVRFQTKQAYDEAVVVFDVVKMPVGCATWPALWTVAGATWPHNGEIDVVEGIGYTNEASNANLMSVHMADDSPNTASSSAYTGTQTTSNCKTNYGAGQDGCSIRDANNHGPSWGTAFNQAGGGVWAVQFGRGHGVKIWFWGRTSNALPKALSSAKQASQTLEPSTWGEPMASFQSFDIDFKLKSQNIVLDITINGDWAGSKPMDGMCAGSSRQQALQSGDNYREAEFILNGIDIYTSSSLFP